MPTRGAKRGRPASPPGCGARARARRSEAGRPARGSPRPSSARTRRARRPGAGTPPPGKARATSARDRASSTRAPRRSRTPALPRGTRSRPTIAVFDEAVRLHSTSGPCRSARALEEISMPIREQRAASLPVGPPPERPERFSRVRPMGRASTRDSLQAKRHSEACWRPRRRVKWRGGAPRRRGERSRDPSGFRRVRRPSRSMPSAMHRHLDRFRCTYLRRVALGDARGDHSQSARGHHRQIALQPLEEIDGHHRSVRRRRRVERDRSGSLGDRVGEASRVHVDADSDHDRARERLHEHAADLLACAVARGVEDEDVVRPLDAHPRGRRRSRHPLARRQPRGEREEREPLGRALEADHHRQEHVLAAAASQVPPWRPRPAVWRSATKVARAARQRAAALASSFVEGLVLITSGLPS